MDILLVDDDSYNQELASLLLSQDDHRVTVADNGKRALEELSRSDFEVVFLDMEMPILNGIETAEIIRSCETAQLSPEQRPELPIAPLIDKYKGRHLFLIAMTGNDDQGSRSRCKNAGMDEFLAKPYSLLSFRRVLQRHGKGLVGGEGKEGDKPASAEHESGRELFQAAFAHMKNIYPLEDEQVAMLLQESVKSIQLGMVGIERGIAAMDLAVVASASHRIKGTLMGMGLDEQIELARALESSAKIQKQQESERLAMALAASVSSLVEKGNL